MSRPALAWVRTHPVLAGALACALVGTANAEYTLATGTHVNEYVALAVPGALDLYVIQALRVHRDVAAAVLVMVAANVASHLLAAGLYPDGYWWDFGITAGVGALAPGIVWRVHSLERTRTRSELLWGLPAGAVKTPDEYVHPEPAPVIAPAMDYGWSAPDHVPDEWPPAVQVHPGTDPHDECDVPEDASAVHLNLGDEEYIALAREYVGNTGAPTVRGLKQYAKVGQARAERLLDYLGARP